MRFHYISTKTGQYPVAWMCSLGLGDTDDRGDEPSEMGDALPPVDLGTGRTALAITAGWFHSCALLDDHRVKCWGNDHGGLGQYYPEGGNRGDEPDEMGDNLPAVDLGTGRTASAIAGGVDFTCAVLDDFTVKCWGQNMSGQLGLGDKTWRGANPGEMGDALAPVSLGTGRSAVAVATGSQFTCVTLDDGSVKCWGYNGFGQLGIGDTRDRGDEV